MTAKRETILTDKAMLPRSVFLKFSCINRNNTITNNTMSPFKKLAASLALLASVANVTHAGENDETVKVGVLHSLSGTMAISETSLRDILLFTFDEINTLYRRADNLLYYFTVGYRFVIANYKDGNAYRIQDGWIVWDKQSGWLWEENARVAT